MNPVMNIVETTQQKRHALRVALRAADHPLRIHILNALSQRINGMAVEDITEELRKNYNPSPDWKLEQPMTSQHLIILKKAQLVYDVKDGKRRIYHIDAFALNQLDALCRDWADEPKEVKTKK